MIFYYYYYYYYFLFRWISFVSDLWEFHLLIDLFSLFVSVSLEQLYNVSLSGGDAGVSGGGDYVLFNHRG